MVFHRVYNSVTRFIETFRLPVSVATSAISFRGSRRISPRKVLAKVRTFFRCLLVQMIEENFRVEVFNAATWDRRGR